ncbi:universal stress protein [Sorangium sp. So ce375]|uniref:universal stress protein n=1 Tax=Sorangium sp. So ce375 TaxID=3133306 RepID=UPI003F5C8445
MLSAVRDGSPVGLGAPLGAAPAAESPPGAYEEADEHPPQSGLQRRNVVVALHGRRAHLGAVALGRLVARGLDAPLHGLCLCAEPIDASEVPAHFGIAPEALQGMVLDIEASDDPAGALASSMATYGTTLVIVASHADEPMDERLGVGYLAARALESAARGVLVIREEPSVIHEEPSPPRLRRILLPLDGTPSTASSITPVGEVARKLGAELDIVMVGCASPREAADEGPPVSTPAPSEPGAMVAPLYVDQPQHEWPAFTEEFLARFLSAIGHCPHGVSTRFFLGKGEPAAEILRLSWQLASDLVVLVWHGQLDDEHGGIIRDVLARAPCPVLVLRR